MRKKLLTVSLTVLISVFVATGIIYAASHNVTSTLGGTTGDFFDVDGTMIFDSIKVGAQDVGGVTFFNGTIINDTTTDDANNPVTFGDNVRIDGRIYRGATAGSGDGLPIIVNDDMEVIGTLTVSELLGDEIVTVDNIAGGAVTQSQQETGTATQTTTQNPNDYDLLSTEVNITTGNSTLMIMFSGVLSNNYDTGTGRVFLVLDDEVISHTIRRGTSVSGADTFTLSFNALENVSAGSHTVSVGWNTNTASSTLSLFNHTLDVVELKK